MDKVILYSLDKEIRMLLRNYYKKRTLFYQDRITLKIKMESKAFHENRFHK